MDIHDLGYLGKTAKTKQPRGDGPYPDNDYGDSFTLLEAFMFFVYGVSMTLAKKQAAKKCSTSVGAHPNRRQLSPAEYQAKLDDMAQHLFETMKPQRLSHSLSTPALCQQYIVLAMTQEAHRDVHIRYHKLSDKVNPKTKKPIINLVVFNGEAAA